MHSFTLLLIECALHLLPRAGGLQTTPNCGVAESRREPLDAECHLGWQRCSNNAKAIHWGAAAAQELNTQCQFQRISTARLLDLLERLPNHHIAFWGDSLLRQVYHDWGLLLVNGVYRDVGSSNGTRKRVVASSSMAGFDDADCHHEQQQDVLYNFNTPHGPSEIVHFDNFSVECYSAKGLTRAQRKDFTPRTKENRCWVDGCLVSARRSYGPFDWTRGRVSWFGAARRNCSKHREGFVDSLKREGCPDVVVSGDIFWDCRWVYQEKASWPGYTGYVADIRAGHEELAHLCPNTQMIWKTISYIPTSRAISAQLQKCAEGNYCDAMRLATSPGNNQTWEVVDTWAISGVGNGIDPRTDLHDGNDVRHLNGAGVRAVTNSIYSLVLRRVGFGGGFKYK